MRSVSSTAPQTLSAEAASVLKHSLTLARRRGHAQVTPLHVAGTLLTSRTSLLRTACLKSQQQPQNHHPLQCRALELCFNVALNRLPATPGPLLHAQPSLSNALVAALKRAQAHQRRGCVEQQNQQQIMGVKVELDQLVLSILDDPSVSRVMREAGFSSTKVKECLEECNSYGVSSVFYNACGGIYSTPSSPPSESGGSRVVYNSNPYRSYGYNKEGFNINSLWDGSNSAGLFHNPLVFSPEKRVFSRSYNPSADYSCIKDDDVKLVFEVFLRKKRRNAAVIGDSVSMAEGLVSEVMKKLERDDTVHVDLRSAHIIKFQFSSVPLTFMKREEVEINVGDLKKKIDAFTSDGRSVLVYTGDLKWTVDDRTRTADDNINNQSGRGLITVYNPVDHLVVEMGKLISWYNSCNAKVWLMATASYQTYMKCQMKQPPLDVQWNLQAVSVPISAGLGLSLDGAAATTSMNESRTNYLSQALDKKPCNVKEEQDSFLSCCQECTSNYEKEASFKSDFNGSSSQLPSWLKPHGNTEKDDLAQLRSKYNNLCRNLHQGRRHNSPIHGEKGCSSPSYYPYWPKKFDQSPVSIPRFRRQQSCHIEFSFCDESTSKRRSSEPNLNPLKAIDDKEVKITLALGTSTYSDDASKIERTSSGSSSLCRTLRENVPWQCETIPLIAEVLMDHKTNDQDKLILFEGNDSVGIRRITVGIASSMFGSSDLLFLMNMKENTNTAKENLETLENALKTHEKLVVLIEDVEYADPEFIGYLVDEKLRTLTRGEKDVIFVLTVNGGTRLHEPYGNDSDNVIEMKLLVEESNLGLGVPANKRKGEWDFSTRSSKSPRNNEAEEVSSETTKQSSLDLNALADESERKPQESTWALLEMVKNRFTLNANPDGEEKAKEMFSLTLRRAFHRTVSTTTTFNIDEGVLEEIHNGSGLYLDGLFEQWSRDVFETSLRMVNGVGKDKVSVRLCLGGGKGGKCGLGKGYRNTSLPKKIQVSFTG